MKSASLYFKEGSSDKVYHATVEPNGSKFVVNFSYGRRGGTMNTGTKTNAPVSLEEAIKAWEKLVNSKLAKGYRHMTDTQGAIPQASLPDTPTEALCVLLNPVDEDEAQRLMDDPKWAAQPKFDGVRFMLGSKNGKIYALNRKGKPVSVPNQIANHLQNLGDNYLLDGELVGETLYVFDLVENEGKCLRNTPVEHRNALLLEKKAGETIQFVPLTIGKDKQKLLDALHLDRGEGIVFKKLGAKYYAGRPASGGDYLKFKFYSTATCVVGKVNQKRSVGLEMSCGTGIGNVTIPANYEIPEQGDLVEVRYLYAYKGGSLYQPIYLGKRSDIDHEECTLDQLKYKPESEQ